MKYLRCVFLPFLSVVFFVLPAGAGAAAGAAAGAGGVNPLVAERWKVRPVVVVAAGEADPLLVRVREALRETSVREAFIERKMVLYTVVGGVGQRDGARLSAAETAALLSSLGLGGLDGVFLLVGLDGGVKIRAGRDVDLAAVFDEVDRMPMRRER